MSIKTWMREFYEELPDCLARWYWRQAIEHSLRKWEGFKKANLQKHGCRWDDAGNSRIQDEVDDVFYVDGDSCALLRLVGVQTSGIWETRKMG